MSRNVKLLYLGSLDQICSFPSNLLSSESILPCRRCTMIPTVMRSTKQRNVVGSDEHMTSAEVSNALTSGGEWHEKHQRLFSETALNSLSLLSRKERRKSLKKLRRKQIRQEAAEKERLEQLARLEDPAERFRILEEEKLEAQQLEKERLEHEKQERLFQEREKKAQEEFERKQEELLKKEQERKIQEDGEENWRYVEDDGPAEIIWEGNEIIVRKKRVKVPAESAELQPIKNADQSKSNPLPPQSTAFAAYKYPPPSTPDVGEQNPIFGTEQDKTHCPFHIKTGVCRFGTRCSRVHVYPDQSFTLLMRNMYTGPGLIWDQDEGLEHSEEEVAEQYEEFYEDVHSEFLHFGELVNFKVCKNGSSHLRGNVYVHYQTEAGAQAAYNAINGRFYAGKQITCEFVGVTRWRVALCGEYMKGHHMLCSHGSACNFLHCFRNPRGEYDWADWDSPPPRYWIRKVAKLFGYERDYRVDDDIYHDNARKRDRSSERVRGHRSKHRYSDSRVDDYDHSTRHRERRRHRVRDKSYQSSSDDLGSSSRQKRRCRHERSSPGSVGEGTRSRASGGFERDRSYSRDSVDCVDTSEDKAAPMGGDKLDNRDREWKYGRDHELDGHDDEIYRQSRNDKKRGIPPQHERSSRVSTRSVPRDERIHDYRLSYVPKSKKGSPGDEILVEASETEDESERKSRKRGSGERERSKSRRGSKRYSKRLEGDSSGGETQRNHKTSKNGYKRRMHQDSVWMLSGEDDAFLQSEDRWRPDVDIDG